MEGGSGFTRLEYGLPALSMVYPPCV